MATGETNRVANPKNIIALNGKIYDVTTGSLVNNLIPQRAKISTPKPPKPANSSKSQVNQVIDGVVAPLKATKHAHPAKARSIAKHASRQTQRAKTLARSAARAKASSPGTSRHQGHTKHASTVAKSVLVSRFGHHAAANIVKKVEPLPVAKPLHANGNAAHRSADKHASPKKESADVFATAIENAQSHKQTLATPKKRSSARKKFVSASRTSKLAVSTLLAVIVVGAGVWYFLPNIQLRIASVRSGVNAELPSYQPAGFTRGAIDYKDGQVTVGYKSNSDDRSFTIQQSASKWDNETLLQTFLAPAQQPYQTVEEPGKTIYVYNGSDATWVSDGIWYKIESNSSLNSDQLLRIAKSL